MPYSLPDVGIGYSWTTPWLKASSAGVSSAGGESRITNWEGGGKTYRGGDYRSYQRLQLR